MISVKTPFSGINRILLLAIGLWPYHQTKFVQFHTILFISIIMSSIVFQLTALITAEISLPLLIDVLSFISVCLSVVASYITFSINIQNVKCVLERLQHIFIGLTNENEIAILEKYKSSVKSFTMKYSLLYICIASALVIEPFLPRIQSILLFMNESQPYSIRVKTEYFIDEEKYFYLIMLHIDAVICISLLETAATGSILFGCIQYICFMFKISSYRIQQALTFSKRKDNSMQTNVMNYKKIICAVDFHRKAMEYMDSLLLKFEVFVFFLIGSIAICMTLNLSYMAMFKDDIQEFIQALVRVLGVLFSMLIPNYFGQNVFEHNNHIFFTAYHGQWYMAPLKIQKLILFLLIRGNKPFYMNIGGIFVLSLENFVMMLTASISYFTVVYSFQQ